ncbi:hypothetical protein [Conexibacter sp. DBS9H8]|uniref:hypothetical protein n=1 Tax=Conexibacter sp. DBS9H8 TaxID=2937801 RepID=UPI00200F998E|nr:hypothetical protein [Conexibacter sp. DBS9H8]
MGLIEKLKEGAEQATNRARESVRETQLRHDLTRAYGELGRATFALLEHGGLEHEGLRPGVEHIRELETQLAGLASETA